MPTVGSQDPDGLPGWSLPPLSQPAAVTSAQHGLGGGKEERLLDGHGQRALAGPPVSYTSPSQSLPPLFPSLPTARPSAAIAADGQVLPYGNLLHPHGAAIPDSSLPTLPPISTLLGSSTPAAAALPPLVAPSLSSRPPCRPPSPTPLAPLMSPLAPPSWQPSSLPSPTATTTAAVAVATDPSRAPSSLHSRAPRRLPPPRVALSPTRFSAPSSPALCRPPPPASMPPTASSTRAAAGEVPIVSPPSPVPCASGDAASPQTSTGGTAPEKAPFKATAAFVLKRKGSERPSRTVLGTGGDTPSVPAPAKSPQPTVTPLATQRGQYDAASLAIIRLLCLAAKQLLSLAGAVPKWTGVWLVLEAGDGTAAAPFLGKVINCAAGGTTTAESGAFASDWWAFRGGKTGRLQGHRGRAHSDGGSDKQSGKLAAGGTAPAGGAAAAK